MDRQYSKRKENTCNRQFDGTGMLAIIFLCIIAMPIAGLGMILSDNPETKGLGVVLLFIGLIIWVVLAVQ